MRPRVEHALEAALRLLVELHVLAENAEVHERADVRREVSRRALIELERDVVVSAAFVFERETVEIMDQLGNAILRLAYSYLHNMEDAEDILQETLIKFVTAKPVFENEKHRKAWLLTVAANLAKNRIEYNRVRSSEELNEEIAGAAPEEEEDDLSFVWEAVKKLPDNQREVIHLFYQEGYKTAEIANILGRKEATIRSDLKRARDKLKEILKEANDFE